MKMYILKKKFIHQKLHFQSKIGVTKLHFDMKNVINTVLIRIQRQSLDISAKLLPNHTVFLI